MTAWRSHCTLGQSEHDSCNKECEFHGCWAERTWKTSIKTSPFVMNLILNVIFKLFFLVVEWKAAEINVAKWITDLILFVTRLWNQHYLVKTCLCRLPLPPCIYWEPYLRIRDTVCQQLQGESSAWTLSSESSITHTEGTVKARNDPVCSEYRLVLIQELNK